MNKQTVENLKRFAQNQIKKENFEENVDNECEVEQTIQDIKILLKALKKACNIYDCWE